MNILSVGLSFSLRLYMTGGAPQSVAPLSKLARLGYLFFYTAVLSHLVVFPWGVWCKPVVGYAAPRPYAVYLLLLYATLIGLSVLVEFAEMNWPGGSVASVSAAVLCQGLLGHVFGDCPPC